MFSNLNSRFAAIIDNLSLIPVYLGLNGMSIKVTKFYYTHLSQSNTANRLISLCVSDTLAIDNGLWLAEHISAFTNLRHLSLIDIKRSSFELLLNSLSPIHSVISFSIRFLTFDPIGYTYIGLPDGVYYERIFHLFPSLRICQLLFQLYIFSTLDCDFVLPSNRIFMPVGNHHLNLRSLTVRCSSSFLSHLVEHIPQLQKLNFIWMCPWIFSRNPVRHNSNTMIPICKSVAPNLRSLTITWYTSMMNHESINELFERDVLFSLTNFRLNAYMSDLHVLHNLKSMLSSQCLYSFDIEWFVEEVVSKSETNKILLDIFQQLNEPVPIELELVLNETRYNIRALTLPRMDKRLDVRSYLRRNIAHEQSPGSYNGLVFNKQFVRCNEIVMGENYDHRNEEFLTFSPPIIPWHQITSLSIREPSNRNHLHLLFSQATNLRNLEVTYRSNFDSNVGSQEGTLIELLTDSSLCNMLMSNGLRKLKLITFQLQRNIINIAHSVVKRLPHLQVIQLHGAADENVEAANIFINGLPQLIFLTLSGLYKYGIIWEKYLRDLQNSNGRLFRTEVRNSEDENTLRIWL